MKKLYRKLTQEQKDRGVIFSSQLLPGGIVHEVFDYCDDKEEYIKRLKSDRFFNPSHFTVNLIRT